MSPTTGQIPTRYSPVRRCIGSKLPQPLDLHVLGLPPAFNLSHDQTLQFKIRCRSHQVNPVKKQLKLCSDALNTNTLLFVCSLHLIIGFRQSPSASAHTHCLICLVKKPVSASAQPWEAHYTHLLNLRKRFLFQISLAGDLLKAFRFRFSPLAVKRGAHITLFFFFVNP